MNHIEGLKETVPMFRSVGKAFLLTKKKDIENRFENEMEINTRNQRDLTDRKEYLERRITQNVQNLRDMTQGV